MLVSISFTRIVLYHTLSNISIINTEIDFASNENISRDLVQSFVGVREERRKGDPGYIFLPRLYCWRRGCEENWTRVPLASKSRRRWNRWANNAGPAGSVHRRSRTRKRSIGPTPCHPRIPWVMSRTDPPTRSYPSLFHEVPVAFGTIRCRNPCATKLKVSEGLIHNLELLIDKSLSFSFSLYLFIFCFDLFVCLCSKAKHRAVALWTINTVTNLRIVEYSKMKVYFVSTLVMEENSCYDFYSCGYN